MWLACWIFILHFVADFLLQSRDMGKRKSSEFKVLLQHIGIQFGVIAVGMFGFILYYSFNQPNAALYSLYAVILGSFMSALIFSAANAVIHGIIDWNIWKLYKLSAGYRLMRPGGIYLGKTWPESNPELWQKKINEWQYWEDHWFYTTIGFDQLLHGLTILLLIQVFS